MTVLILSNSLDIHADDVADALAKYGTEYLRLNTDEWYSKNICVHMEYPENGYVYVNGLPQLNLTDITSVLYRRPLTIDPPVDDLNQRKFASGEINELFRQMWYAIQHAKWVNSPLDLEFARRKYSQLIIAGNLGLTIPRTCVTNSPEQAKRFIRQFDKAIYKTMKAPVIDLHGDGIQWGVPTTVLTVEHIERLDLIVPSGGIFQEYIEKAYEVRVTIIGDTVYSAKIKSQESTEHDAHIDWRDGVAYGDVKVESYNLPNKVSDACKGVLREYGLHFGAIDLIRTLDGDYVFLELNPNGQWLWIEDMTNQPLLDGMVRLLSNSSS